MSIVPRIISSLVNIMGAAASSAVSAVNSSTPSSLLESTSSSLTSDISDSDHGNENEDVLSKLMCKLNTNTSTTYTPSIGQAVNINTDAAPIFTARKGQEGDDAENAATAEINNNSSQNGPINLVKLTEDGKGKEPGPSKFNFDFGSCESYMTWGKMDPNPNYVRCIQVAQSHFSSTTVRAFARGNTTPIRGQGQLDSLGDFDENKRYNMFEHITNLGALSFFYLEIQDFVMARTYFLRALESVTQSNQESTIPVDYSESFMYVLGLLGLYAAEVKEAKHIQSSADLPSADPDVNDFGSSKWVYSEIRSFDSLSAKGKAGVYGMKHFFGKMIKMNSDEMLEIIRKAVTLDPEYYEWHYCTQATLRSKRRFHSYHHFQPNPVAFDEEKDAICTANQLMLNHPRCMLAEITFLADILKCHFNQFKESIFVSLTPPKWKPLYYRNMKFDTVESVVHFIQEQVKKIIALSPTSVHINTTVAEIFTLLLPHQFRDFNFAKECLERALRFHPWSSKANHRMGTFFLNRGKHKDICHGMICSYFERAMTMDETNYPSLCALIQVLMQQLPINVNLILNLIDRKLTMDCWDPIQTAGLHYFRGLIFYTAKKWKESIDAFKEAHDLDSNSLTFEDLAYQHRRYRWPEDSTLVLGQMVKTWRKVKGRTKNPQRKQFIGILISKAGEGITQEKKYQERLMLNKKRRQGHPEEKVTLKSDDRDSRCILPTSLAYLLV